MIKKTFLYLALGILSMQIPTHGFANNSIEIGKTQIMASSVLNEKRAI